MANLLQGTNSPLEETMETNRTSSLPGTNHMDLLVQNMDDLSVNSGSNAKNDASLMPGCQRCLLGSCKDPWCPFCTRGFCYRGALCKNIYSHFAMCGSEINYCRDGRQSKNRVAIKRKRKKTSVKRSIRRKIL